MNSNKHVSDVNLEEFKSILEEMKYQSNDECEPLRISLITKYEKVIKENNKMYIIIFKIFRKILDDNIEYDAYKNLLFDFIEEVIYYDKEYEI